MDKKFDMVAVGDLMLDFTYTGTNEDGISIYERNPGGSPMNVAAQLNKLGGKASVIATVGSDEHGQYLKNVIENLGIDTSGVGFSETMGTRMLFVHFNEGNDRYFFDYKGPRADLDIRMKQVDTNVLVQSKVFLYTPLAHEIGYPIYETVNELLKIARENKNLIAYDPNYRFPYKTKEEQERVVKAVRTANILKMTIEEAELVLGKTDVLALVDELLEDEAMIVAVTMGPNGCLLCNRNGKVYRPTYNVPVIDTCGAGDSFMGALIYAVTHAEKMIDDLTGEELEAIADFCNACASGATMRHGSLLVMPDQELARRIRTEVPAMEQQLIF